MANHDFLTSLLNRREAFRQIGEEVERANRTARPLAFILFDIDHFKRLNDTYGHNAGDMVLTQLAVKLKAALRDYDIACRYGGEEFLVVSPETDLEQALRLAERLRVTIASTSFSTESAELPVTVSIGVTLWQQDDTIEKAIARADEALYQAKAGGRNQVCSA
jgi:diguanylate cyclase (GGDEF)-like protein